MAVTTGISFGLAGLIPTAITVKNPDFTPTPRVTIGIYAAVLVSHGIVNTFGVRILRHLNNFSILLHSAGITALCIAVLAKAPTHQSAKFVFGTFNDGTGVDDAEGWGSRATPVYVAVCGALLSQYTLTGFDASAHLSEETKKASWSAPIGVVSSVGFSALFGFFVLMAMLFSVQDLDRVLNSQYGQPVLQILVDVAGENGALALFSLIIGEFCLFLFLFLCRFRLSEETNAGSLIVDTNCSLCLALRPLQHDEQQQNDVCVCPGRRHRKSTPFLP